jgi:hypothetical protein
MPSGELRLARRAREGLLELAELPKEQRDELVAAFGSLDPFAGFEEFVAVVRALLPDASEPHARDLAGALITTVQQMHYRDLEQPSDLADAVVRSPDLDLTDDQAQALRDLIGRVADLPPLWSTAKAIDLMSEQEHPLTAARILTDVRPIFGPGVNDGPQGAVVFQVLKVDHYTDGHRSTIAFALDNADLLELKKTVDRAIAKTESLKAWMQTAGLSYFEVEGGDDGGAA